MILESIVDAIGNTPLLHIDQKIHGLEDVRIYAKLEMLNPFGSIKDRTALALLGPHLPKLRQTDTSIIESSSGNTAKALQLLASMNELDFTCVTNRIRVQETREILQVLGATIEELPGRADCHDPRDPNDPHHYLEKRVQAAHGKLFAPRQYYNEANPDVHYRTTGEEIARDLPSVDIVVGAVGTSGSTRGVIEKLREANPHCELIGAVSDPSDFIPGMRNEEELWEVGLFERDRYNALVRVTSSSAIDGMLHLARRCGVLCGPTSGACYSAAIQTLSARMPAPGHTQTVLLIICDRLEWYLSYLRERRPEMFGIRRGGAVIDSQSLPPTNVSQLSCREAADRIERRELTAIDTRSALAYRAGHIAGSLNIPSDTLQTLLGQGPPFSRSSPLLFVCPVGKESQHFAAYLSSRGFDAYSLTGGLIQWRDDGFELERDAWK